MFIYIFRIFSIRATIRILCSVPTNMEHLSPSTRVQQNYSSSCRYRVVVQAQLRSCHPRCWDFYYWLFELKWQKVDNNDVLYTPNYLCIRQYFVLSWVQVKIEVSVGIKRLFLSWSYNMSLSEKVGYVQILQPFFTVFPQKIGKCGGNWLGKIPSGRNTKVASRNAG